MDGGCPGQLTSLRAPAGPSLVGMVQKDWASHNSIALSWKEAEQPSLPVLDYEIKYYEKVQQLPKADYLSVPLRVHSLWSQAQAVLSVQAHISQNKTAFYYQ